MNPHTAWALCGQRQEELAAGLRAPQTSHGPRARSRAHRRRGFPRWYVSWARLPGDLPGAAGHPRSSWLIIISATRPGGKVPGRPAGLARW